LLIYSIIEVQTFTIKIGRLPNKKNTLSIGNKMQLNFETESKENSQVLLKVTIDKSEVKKSYQDFLIETQKDIQIPGFRKGKVPFSILETKFKDAIIAEVSTKLIDDSYKEVIEKVEKKPLNFSTPKLEELKKMELNEDFTYQLTYDVYPEIKYGEYKGIEIEKDEVSVTDSDIKKEIDTMVKEFATIETKDGKIEDNDIVQVEYIVTKDGVEVNKKDSEYIHIGKDYDLYKIGKDILGLKKDDTKEFKKKFPKGEIESLAEKTFEFKVKIKDVKKEIIPELTDDLAKQINENCSTVSELKEIIKKDMETFAVNTVKNKTIELIMNKLSETFAGDIPKSMIDEQLDVYWKEFIERFRGDEKKAISVLSRENKTKESYKESFRQKAIEELKKALIIQDIVKKENIKATEDDIKKHLESFAKYYKMKVDDLFDIYKKSNQLQIFENEVESKMAVDFIFDNVKSKKGKKLSLEELLKKDEEKEDK